MRRKLKRERRRLQMLQTLTADQVQRVEKLLLLQYQVQMQQQQHREPESQPAPVMRTLEPGPTEPEVDPTADLAQRLGLQLPQR